MKKYFIDLQCLYCGTPFRARRDHLLSGHTKSCGCLSIKIGTLLSKIYGHVNGLKRLRHGHNRVGRRTPEYLTWGGIIHRCINPKSPAYYLYGKRGIKVCERWRIFNNFLVDMGTRPLGTTIDRINNNDDYKPGNCHWATPKEQSLNRRKR